MPLWFLDVWQRQESGVIQIRALWSGAIWSHLEPFGAEPFGAILVGAIWSHLEPFRVEPFGAILVGAIFGSILDITLYRVYQRPE